MRTSESLSKIFICEGRFSVISFARLTSKLKEGGFCLKNLREKIHFLLKKVNESLKRVFSCTLWWRYLCNFSDLPAVEVAPQCPEVAAALPLPWAGGRGPGETLEGLRAGPAARGAVLVKCSAPGRGWFHRWGSALGVTVGSYRIEWCKCACSCR